MRARRGIPTRASFFLFFHISNRSDVSCQRKDGFIEAFVSKNSRNQRNARKKHRTVKATRATRSLLSMVASHRSLGRVRESYRVPYQWLLLLSVRLLQYLRGLSMTIPRNAGRCPTQALPTSRSSKLGLTPQGANEVSQCACSISRALLYVIGPASSPARLKTHTFFFTYYTIFNRRSMGGVVGGILKYCSSSTEVFCSLQSYTPIRPSLHRFHKEKNDLVFACGRRTMLTVAVVVYQPSKGCG